MINPFGIGKQIGKKIIKPVVNTFAGAVWGLIAPAPRDDICIHSSPGRLELTPEALRETLP